LKIALVETGVDVGPAIYLARIFDTDVDSVVKFFIFILIFVFDPMAVMFVISYNVTLQYGKEESPQAVASSDSDITTTSKEWDEQTELNYLRDFHMRNQNDELHKIVKSVAPVDAVKEKKKSINTKKQTDPNLKKLEEPVSTVKKLEKGGFSRQ